MSQALYRGLSMPIFTCLSLWVVNKCGGQVRKCLQAHLRKLAHFVCDVYLVGVVVKICISYI